MFDSYASMIRLAISSSPNGKMTLNEIYNYICNAFPYYKEAGKGWMVSCINYKYLKYYSVCLIYIYIYKTIIFLYCYFRL